jgi:hypothetical protein
VVPPHVDKASLSFLEKVLARRASNNCVENIVARRGFGSWLIDGIGYTIDCFNPADELELGYRGAGEPVLALPIGGDYQGIRDHLGDKPSFYTIIQGVADIVRPRCVVAASDMSNVTLAIAEGRLSRSFSPWDFLFPVTVRRRDPAWPDLATLRRLFYRVERWEDDRVLLQVRVGLDEMDIGQDYPAAAEPLGLVATQELIPGIIEHIGHRLRKP